MSSVQDWDDARRSADQHWWKVIAVLAVITVVGFGALFAYDSQQEANETCSERKAREAKELGIPMMYDPRTGLASGCTD